CPAALHQPGDLRLHQRGRLHRLGGRESALLPGEVEMSPAPLDAVAASDVKEVANTFVTLRSGERIAVRLFLPVDADAKPVPAILDYFPYRKSDFSCWRDSTTYAYMAKRGYACVKADSRGTGDSDGLQLDQFSPRYVDDAVEVIDWIARQPWCN